jgi:hypothetical protein
MAKFIEITTEAARCPVQMINVETISRVLENPLGGSVIKFLAGQDLVVMDEYEDLQCRLMEDELEAREQSELFDHALSRRD